MAGGWRLATGEPYPLAEAYDQPGELTQELAQPPGCPDAIYSMCEPPVQTYDGKGAIRKLREHLQNVHGLPFTEALVLAG